MTAAHKYSIANVYHARENDLITVTAFWNGAENTLN